MQQLWSLTENKHLTRSFCLGHIPDILGFFFFKKIIIEFIMNLSTEYQGFCNLEYFIILIIALQYYSTLF